MQVASYREERALGDPLTGQYQDRSAASDACTWAKNACWPESRLGRICGQSPRHSEVKLRYPPYNGFGSEDLRVPWKRYPLATGRVTHRRSCEMCRCSQLRLFRKCVSPEGRLTGKLQGPRGQAAAAERAEGRGVDLRSCLRKNEAYLKTSPQLVAGTSCRTGR